MDFEDTLQQIGDFGLYQRRLFLLLSVCSTPAAFQVMGIVFLAGTPDHWCWEPELDRFNLTLESRMQLSIPKEVKDGEMHYSRCEMYDVNFRRYTQRNADDLLSRIVAGNTSDGALGRKACTQWMYDPNSPYTSTIVTEWDLVCDRRWMVPTAASIFMAGLMCGVYFFGEVADRFGRRRGILISLAIFLVTSNIVAFSPNYVFFVLVRFIVAFTAIGCFTTSFILRMEIVGTRWRVITAILGGVFWPLGNLILVGIAYAVPEWMKLQITLSIPGLLLLSYFWFAPESPRWLLARNREQEAQVIIDKIARINGAKLSGKVDKAIQVDEFVIKPKKAGISDLIRFPNLRKKTVCICFNWFVVSLVYYGLSLATSSLSGNDYLNFLAVMGADLPADVVQYFTLTRVGRRLTLFGGMSLGGIFLLLTIPVPKDMAWLSTLLAMLGKVGISVSFGTVYIYSAELFPTEVRNIGIGTGSLSARIGGIIAPYIAELAVFSKHLPIIVFGAFAITAGIVALFLPETKGHALPQTIDEGEQFGKVIKRQDKATWTSDEEVYTISAADLSLEGSDGYSTDMSEWIPNYADRPKEGVHNGGFGHDRPQEDVQHVGSGPDRPKEGVYNAGYSSTVV